jgi:DNA replication protein DnaC
MDSGIPAAEGSSSRTPAQPRCPVCAGTGYQILEDREHGRSTARVCACRRTRRIEDLLRLSRIPRRYTACEFATFESQDSSQESALAQTRAFVDSYTVLKVQEEADVGLLFLGPPGVGKTHLAVAALRSLILEQGVPGLFIDFRDLIKELQASYDPVAQTSEMEILRPLLQTEVLVLDDMGAARVTEWVRDLIGHIVNSRYNERKATLLTTNLADDAGSGAAKRPASSGEGAPSTSRIPNERASLADRIGEPIRSRLHEMCITLRLSGEDYRVKLKASNRQRLK